MRFAVNAFDGFGRPNRFGRGLFQVEQNRRDSFDAFARFDLEDPLAIDEADYMDTPDVGSALRCCILWRFYMVD